MSPYDGIRNLNVKGNESQIVYAERVVSHKWERWNGVVLAGRSGTDFASGWWLMGLRIRGDGFERMDSRGWIREDGFERMDSRWMRAWLIFIAEKSMAWKGG
jgi:hypothetical protein